ncbi:hypothetical protein OF122_15915 [Pelagibacterium flavum]|mgnify:FL=1|uniref:CoxF protein n=1 Tax=Pelagibacterium flavum TaxID=2984530 RepID=A0ABY6ILP6_9HYPH|nr:hypothetical protein [Pelagibacterium sp. YIM 151497]UYQ71518.1 hypothetical protein OF122_15915 [Pelagibacterium sp. YIM 151497]|tara:strand:+ start:1401 stop:1565 length:165 start_codon:yes stop_codon:yes gene_type:complete
MTVEQNLTEQQREAFLKRRRKRSIAIGVALVILVAIFYAITIINLGPEVMVREL